MNNFTGSKTLRILSSLLTIVLLSTALLISGCSKDESDDNPLDPGNGGIGGNTSSNSITLNGGGYTNKTVNFNISIGAFIASENMTAVMMSGVSGNDSVFVGLSMSGNAAGTFDWEDYTSETSKTYVIIRIGGLTNPNAAVLISPLGTGKTIITGYGSVGQNIAGTFSGTLLRYSDQSQITVTGKFSALRSANE